MSDVALRLRQKLLDLAIRGKLVPQDEKDEPAETLLALIRAERFQTGSGKDDRVEVERCRKGRACRSATAVPISDDEKPFDLPKGWCWCRMGEVGRWGAGTTPSRKNAAYYKGGKTPWLKTGDLNDSVVSVVPEFVTQKALDETSLHVNPVGTVLIAMYGATIGKIGILGIEATTNQACCACQVSACVLNKYLFYYLLSQRSKLKAMGGGGAQPNISKDIIVSYPIPLPPLAEQNRIVAALDGMLAAADAVAAGTEKIAALKDKTRAKILDLAIRGKLVKQDKNDESAEELLKRIVAERAQLVAQKKLKKEKPLSPIEEDDAPYDLPRGWAWCRFADVINYLRPDPYIVHSEEYDDSYSTPVLTAGLTFILGRTDEADGHYHASKQKPVIIFDDFTTSTQWVDFEFKVKSSAMKLLEPILADLVDLRYLYFAIQNVQYKPSTHSRQWIDKFSKFPLALPPLAEQKRIVAKVDEMLAACDALTGGVRGA